jgi:mevalonate kinase
MHNYDQLSKTYHGKLLLAGEYTVINGGNSLAIPYPATSAFLYKNAQTPLTSFWEELKTYFLREKIQLNFDLFQKDTEAGLGYESNIPIGYGCGSSGALIACIYERYKTEDIDFDKLQALLGSMESYFHGTSSGIDPFVIYLNRAIFTKDGQTNVIDSKSINLSGWKLLDSKISRSTAHYVSIFKNEIKHSKSTKIEKLMSLNNTLIENFLNNQTNLDVIAQISQLQFEVFQPMIPEIVKPIWQKGLEEQSYFVKLCGAGGGGYFLMYGDGDDNFITLTQQ